MNDKERSAAAEVAMHSRLEAAERDLVAVSGANDHHKREVLRMLLALKTIEAAVEAKIAPMGMTDAQALANCQDAIDVVRRVLLGAL